MGAGLGITSSPACIIAGPGIACSGIAAGMAQNMAEAERDPSMATHDATYSLADLRAQLAELDTKIAADAKKRRRLAVAVAALEALEGRPKKTPAPKRTVAPVVVSEPGREAMQIHDAAAIVLREAGRPLNATAILNEINSRGLVGRQLVRTSVVSALDRKYHDGELFDKPQPGTYVLISGNVK